MPPFSFRFDNKINKTVNTMIAICLINWITKKICCLEIAINYRKA